ncbi:hypothetical protein ACH47B_31240 [Rhodococcus sp. NPDC019627]|uniref:hypothetical protein n=1 Tax=unclassified Rhodococcus (in: high G+C Gram-positive bacteria) TaxID=192944 RepID=UPI0033C65314
MRWAASVAVLHRATLHLAHAIPIPTIWYGEPYPTPSADIFHTPFTHRRRANHREHDGVRTRRSPHPSLTCSLLSGARTADVLLDAAHDLQGVRRLLRWQRRDRGSRCRRARRRSSRSTCRGLRRRRIVVGPGRNSGGNGRIGSNGQCRDVDGAAAGDGSRSNRAAGIVSNPGSPVVVDL